MIFKPILYSYYNSSCSYRVRIVLHLKNIAYEYKAMDIYKDGGQGDQHTEEFKAKNPFRFVPALQVAQGNERHTLFESMAIIDYLEQTYPQNSIYPKDSIDRAKAIAVAETVASGIQPLQHRKVLTTLDKLGGNRLEWAKNMIREKFEGLEKFLRSTSGKYCIKDSISIADICLVPQVYNAMDRYNIKMENFPTIDRVRQLLEQNDAFKAANPLNQPDAPS